MILNKKPERDLNPSETYEVPIASLAVAKRDTDFESIDVVVAQEKAQVEWARNVKQIRGDYFKPKLDKENMQVGVILTQIGLNNKGEEKSNTVKTMVSDA